MTGAALLVWVTAQRLACAVRIGCVPGTVSLIDIMFVLGLDVDIRVKILVCSPYAHCRYLIASWMSLPCLWRRGDNRPSYEEGSLARAERSISPHEAPPGARAYRLGMK